MNCVNIGQALGLKTLNRWKKDPEFGGIVADKDHILYRKLGDQLQPVVIDSQMAILTLKEHRLKVTTRRVNEVLYGFNTLLTKAIVK